MQTHYYIIFQNQTKIQNYYGKYIIHGIRLMCSMCMSVSYVYLYVVLHVLYIGLFSTMEQ